VLVANRGEIARRVFATCRRLGIGTVAVHSDADAGLPFVDEADFAVRLPGVSPAETYLRGDLIVEAARRAGAGELLEDLRLFDVYAGHPVPEGSRSLAYAMTLRAPDRTLTGDEADGVRRRAVEEVGRRTGAVLRG